MRVGNGSSFGNDNLLHPVSNRVEQSDPRWRQIFSRGCVLFGLVFIDVAVVAMARYVQIIVERCGNEVLKSEVEMKQTQWNDGVLYAAHGNICIGLRTVVRDVFQRLEYRLA